MPSDIPRQRLHRLYLIVGILIALLTGMAFRFVWLVDIDGTSLRAFAADRVNTTVKIHGLRGEITDRKGRPLAFSKHTFDVWVYTPNVDNIPALARTLAADLNIPRDTIMKKISNPRRKYVPVARYLDLSIMERFDGGRLPGVTFEPSQRRLYPYGSMACHLIGFVAGDGRGLEGVERMFDSELSPQDGKRVYMRDNRGRLLADVSQPLFAPVDGQRIVLTIDRDIQHIAEEELAKTVQKFTPAGASAIVIDPTTGDILALANYPAYNPNDRTGTRIEQYRNRAIVDQYEPGSTFKSFLLSLAMDRGAITPDTPRFDLEDGRWRIGRRTLRDSHRPEPVPHSPALILAISSNIGAAKIALHTYGGLTGQDLAFSRGASKQERAIDRMKISDAAWDFYSDLQKFGFGKPTGIEFPGEASGRVRPPQEWTRDSLLSIPMGQEIAVTPLQLIRGYAAIANGGLLLKPHLVLRRETLNGQRIEERHVEVQRRAITEKTAFNMRVMLRGVIKHGRLRKLDTPKMKLGGKTGTSQIAENGRYQPGKYVGSFCGMAPYYEPKLVVLVTVREPDRKKGYYGATVAAPVVAAILNRSLALQRLEEMEKQPLHSPKSGTIPAVK